MSPEEKLPALTRPTLARLYKQSLDAQAATVPLIARGYLSPTFARELVTTHDKILAEIAQRGGQIGEFGEITWPV